MLERRYKPEHETGDEPHGQRKDQCTSVDRYFVEARQAARRYRKQDPKRMASAPTFACATCSRPGFNSRK